MNHHHSARVLLVEDDFALASTMVDLLAALGYKPELAESAIEAYESLRHSRNLDVVLLDLQLGRERGESLIQRLREAGVELPPIVILSALPIKALMQAAQVTRAQGILQKPCSAQQLVDAIEHVLN